MWDYRPMLKVFINNPMEGFTIRQLSKLSNLGYATAHKCVEILESDGVLNSSPFGKGNRISLNYNNSDCAVYLAQAEMLTTNAFKSQNKKFYEKLTNLIQKMQIEFQYGLYSIVLFGSYAKNMANSKSDVDLLILKDETKKQKDILAQIVSPWEFENNKKVNPALISPANYISMIKNNEMLSLQIIQSHIVVLNSETYWRFNLGALKNG